MCCEAAPRCCPAQPTPAPPATARPYLANQRLALAAPVAQHHIEGLEPLAVEAEAAAAAAPALGFGEVCRVDHAGTGGGVGGSATSRRRWRHRPLGAGGWLGACCSLSRGLGRQAWCCCGALAGLLRQEPPSQHRNTRWRGCTEARDAAERVCDRQIQNSPIAAHTRPLRLAAAAAPTAAARTGASGAAQRGDH